MNDNLYEAFRIYQLENLIGLTEEEAKEKIKDYRDEKRKVEAMDAYMKVTHDPILGPMIPELTYYDMEHNPQKIKELYSESLRKQQAESPIINEQSNAETSLTNKETDMGEDLNKHNKMTEAKEVTSEPESIKPGVVISEQPSLSMSPFKEKKLSKKLNQVGYANIVLMSIIVIIIVAIVCVFIFAN